MTAAVDPNPTFRELLDNAAYRWFILGITSTNTGQFLSGLASPFLVKQLTDSNGWVGTVGFAGLIPALLVTPLAGTLADRIDRRTILLVAYSVQVLVTSGLLATYATGNITPEWLLLFSFLGGTAAGFQWAPIQSMAAVLVPREQLIAAVRWVSISFTAGRAVGPALAGIILHFYGPGHAFAGTLFSYVLGLTLLSRVRTSFRSTDAAPTSFGSQIADGIRYIRAHPDLKMAMVMSFLVASTAAVWVFSLTASLAEDIFDVDGGGLGLLATAAGLGSVVGSIIISGTGGNLARSRMEAATLAAYVTGLLIVPATTTLWIGLVGFLFAGAAHMLHGVTVTTALQVQVAEEYRGRVTSVFMASILGGLPIGTLIGGALADVFDIRLVMVGFTAALAVAAATLVATTDRLAFLDAKQGDDDAMPPDPATDSSTRPSW